MTTHRGDEPGPPGYRRRVVDTELDDLLPSLAAIALEGPRGVGKTMTAGRRARTQYRLDVAASAQILRADPASLTRATPPVLVDEWQVLPETWDVVRRAVDDGAAPGSYLLTGSASPRPGSRVHTGAGRIVVLRMRPMAMCERGVAETTVSLRGLLGGGVHVGGESRLTLGDYVEEIVASGLPGIRPMNPRARRLALDGYLRRVVDHDVSEQGRAVRQPTT